MRSGRKIFVNYDFEIYEFRNAFAVHRFASLAPDVEHPIMRYQPLDYSRILPWLIARPCSTLESAVALQRCPRILGTRGHATTRPTRGL